MAYVGQTIRGFWNEGFSLLLKGGWHNEIKGQISTFKNSVFIIFGINPSTYNKNSHRNLYDRLYPLNDIGEMHSFAYICINYIKFLIKYQILIF